MGFDDYAITWPDGHLHGIGAAVGGWQYRLTHRSPHRSGVGAERSGSPRSSALLFGGQLETPRVGKLLLWSATLLPTILSSTGSRERHPLRDALIKTPPIRWNSRDLSESFRSGPARLVLFPSFHAAFMVLPFSSAFACESAHRGASSLVQALLFFNFAVSTFWALTLNAAASFAPLCEQRSAFSVNSRRNDSSARIGARFFRRSRHSEARLVPISK